MSAASRSALLSPPLEGGERFPLIEAPPPDLARDNPAQHREDFALEFQWQGGSGTGEEYPGQPAPPRNQHRIFRLEQSRGVTRRNLYREFCDGNFGDFLGLQPAFAAFGYPAAAGQDTWVYRETKYPIPAGMAPSLTRRQISGASSGLPLQAPEFSALVPGSLCEHEGSCAAGILPRAAS